MNTRRSLLGVACLFTCLFLIGCDGGGSDSSSSNNNSSTTSTQVTGTWRGSCNCSSLGVSGPTTLTVTQAGTQVTGTWDGLAVSGTFQNNELLLTASTTQSGVTITFTMIGTMNGNSMTFGGTATGSMGSVSLDYPFTCTTLTR